MKVLDSEDLLAGIDHTEQGISQLKDQCEKIQKNIEELVALEESFKGEGGQSIRSFYDEVHLPFLRYWKSTMDQYNDVLTQLVQSLQSFEPAPQAVIKQQFLDHDVTEGLKNAEQTTRALTDEGNSIIQSVSDIVALPKLDDGRFIDHVKLAENHKEETIEDLHSFDRSGTNRLLPIEQEVATLRRIVNEMNGMFQAGELSLAQYQPNQLTDRLAVSLSITQLSKFLSHGLSAVKDGQEGLDGVGHTSILAEVWDGAKFNIAEFSGFNDLLRIVNGVDPITGTEISNQERLKYALLMFMRFSVSRNSAKEVEKEETEELNFFEKSMNSFKEIGQDVWHGLENRADKMFDSPYDFANYITLGLPDGVKGTWEGAKIRSEKATDSFYDFFNYLSFGNVDMINGAINTDDPFSKEHWLNSFGVFTLATGSASLVTKAGKPKSIGTPETGNTTKAIEGIQKETKEFFTDVKNGGTIFVNELSNLINRPLFPNQGLQFSMANQMPVNVFSRTAIEDRINSVVSMFKSKNTTVNDFDPKTATNKQKGNYGEIISSENLLTNQSIKDAGYDLKQMGKSAPSTLNDKIVKGIDGLYENVNPNSNIKYVIDEAKFGSSQLGKTKDGPQMSDSWLMGGNTQKSRILKAVDEDEYLAIKITRALRKEQVERVLSKVDSNGNVQTFRLDANGDITGEWP